MPVERPLRVAVVGAGYFSQFHLSAWEEMPEVSLVAVCDLDPVRLAAATDGRSARGYDDLAILLANESPDIVDIVAPPVAHAGLIRASLHPGRTIICQKPFCLSLDEAAAVSEEAAGADTRVVIHENFRFQPWYRALKTMLDDGALGSIYQARFVLRPGDGRGAEAYLHRQPAFQKMPRFLIHETGVHFIDLFRWMFGAIDAVYADVRRLNPAISGEDAGVLIFDHQDGTQSIFDGNRHSDHAADNRRKTMGEMTVEGEGGTVRVDGYGRMWLRRFDENREQPIHLDLPVDDDAFGGGCVANLIRHVVDGLVRGAAIENQAGDYLAVMAIDDAAYTSAGSGKKIRLGGSPITTLEP
ncbi:MAG: Gfo/Idh/MocA family oxidoreductase [Hyphomicrobiales bacterium]|nr:Gfo/Idh/MocA family oxidoreductase [Hyphomicrobiales bacterium]